MNKSMNGRMKILRRLCLALLLTGVCVCAQAEKLSADGPYIRYRPDGTAQLIRVTGDGGIGKEEYDSLPEGFGFRVVSHDGKYEFDVGLHPVVRPAWKDTMPKKMFVMSDPHGDLDCVVSLLRANGVIGKKLEWRYGKNRLVVIGDVFDRGSDVTQIFWLLYKLEAEAKKAGGKVDFLLGNHEPMVLSNDLRYTDAKYKMLADSLGAEYASLFGADTELGRWLGTRNTMQVVGPYLFVHAGLGKAFYDLNPDIPFVNREMSRVLFLKNRVRKAFTPLHAFLYGSEGPVWYRGLVRTDAKYKPCAADTVQMLLDRYGVERIIVGHTIFEDISTFYDGRVIGVNVANRKNKQEGRGRAIVIEKDACYAAGDKGRMRRLF